MSNRKTVKLVFPDTGPLISFARANALDLLLVFKDNVHVTVTDYVEFESTRFRDKYRDANPICDFLTKYAGKIVVEPTTTGQLFKKEALAIERFNEDASFRKIMMDMNMIPGPLPENPGELSITSYIKDLIIKPPGTPVLVVAEDDYFIKNTAANPTNAHILSTRSFLDTLYKIGYVQDARTIWNEITHRRPDVSRKFCDRQAEKMETDWVSAIDPEKARNFRWNPPRP